MIERIRNRIANFRARTDGAAAVEFALLLPVFVGLVVGVIQYGGQIVAYQRMHNGLAAGAVYVMRGGSGTTAIHDIAMAGWPSQPADAAVTVTQACTCAGASAGCGAPCADGTYPQSFTTLTGTGTYAGLMGSQSMTSTQVIRTQ
jgi:Flp pilus assembly protein TadG